MYVKKRQHKFEDIEEIDVHDLSKEENYNPSPKVVDVVPPEHVTVLKNIPSDINIFLPIYGGDDFIIIRLGWNVLEKINITLDDVVGRKYSDVLPAHYEVIKDNCKRVLETKQPEKMKLYYYRDNKLLSIAHRTIVEDNGKIYVIDDYTNNDNYSTVRVGTTYDGMDHNNVIDNQVLPNGTKIDRKSDLIEYISQTGRHYKTRNQYMWTPGIYNIINRFPEENDRYYNIVFDLVVDEDQEIVKKLLNDLSPQNPKAKATFRIKTADGKYKHVECHLHAKFDEADVSMNNYGFFRDVTHQVDQDNAPVDHLIDKFMKDSKMALLINPFSMDYSVSDGLYNILELDHGAIADLTWEDIFKNIKEENVIEKIIEATQKKVPSLNEVFTYYPPGSEHPKTLEISLETFPMGDEEFYVGYLVDITSEVESKKQEKVVKKQNVIIKEVHHRIKNNLQILNSFINLERKVYDDTPEIIIGHMQSRINSLAVLHSQTYESMDYENLNLNKTIKEQDESLCSLLDSHKTIEYLTDIQEDLYLPISLITPILLIINELTTNAVKHAFIDRTDNKKIYKHIKLIENETCEFIFGDNGVGMEDFDKNKQNLGLTIIQGLVSQINGKMEMVVDGGTEFTFTFPVNQEYVGYK